MYVGNRCIHIGDRNLSTALMQGKETDMKKRIINYKYGIWLLLIMQLVLVGVTIHDVATAQGVGLYVAIQAGSRDRMSFDLLIDVCGILALLLILLIPFKLLRHHSVDSLFRFQTMYLAFIPTLDMAVLVHLLDGQNLFVLNFEWNKSLTLLSMFVREVIPVMILLYYFYQKGGKRLKKWHKVLLVAEGLIGIGMHLLPELSDVLLHTTVYLLIILAYDWWEELPEERMLSEKVMIWLIIGVLYCRGCFKMLELMSLYQL